MAQDLFFLLSLALVLFFIAAASRLFSIARLRVPRDWERAGISLDAFLNGQARFDRKRPLVFSEVYVRSERFRFMGRLDQAVLHWDRGPVLDAVVERKFPTRHLPDAPRREDVFQASLYALAIEEAGAGCPHTRVITVYCLQRNATRCVERQNAASCLTCRKGRVYSTPFRSGRTQRIVKRLNEEWAAERLRPVRRTEICSSCPYSRGQGCRYSAV